MRGVGLHRHPGRLLYVLLIKPMRSSTANAARSRQLFPADSQSSSTAATAALRQGTGGRHRAPWLHFPCVVMQLPVHCRRWRVVTFACIPMCLGERAAEQLRAAWGYARTC